MGLRQADVMATKWAMAKLKRKFLNINIEYLRSASRLSKVRGNQQRANMMAIAMSRVLFFLCLFACFIALFISMGVTGLSWMRHLRKLQILQWMTTRTVMGRANCMTSVMEAYMEREAAEGQSSRHMLKLTNLISSLVSTRLYIMRGIPRAMETTQIISSTPPATQRFMWSLIAEGNTITWYLSSEMAVIVSTEAHTFTACSHGTSLHTASPRGQLFISSLSKVKGMQNIHMRMSATARFSMNRLRTVRRLFFFRITQHIRPLANSPNMMIVAYSTIRGISTAGVNQYSWARDSATMRTYSSKEMLPRPNSFSSCCSMASVCAAFTCPRVML